MPTKAVQFSPPSTPIYIISGFLGSGKTTLLKRALAYELDRSVKPAVLMNEFGEVDVDEAVLHEHPRSNVIELQSLLNGCICCDLSGEFGEKVRRLVKKSQGAPLFIETTGLADTGQVVTGVEQAMATDRLAGCAAHLASVIVMVDVSQFSKLQTFWPAADQHLERADMIILNKLDQLDPDRVETVEQRIKTMSPTALVLRAVRANVNVPQLLTATSSFRAATVADGAIHISTTGYQSGSFRLTRPMDPVRFEAWLRRYHRSVVRLKGFVRVAGKAGFQEVQWVMGSLTITPYVGVKQSRSKIVVIGRRIAWQRFLEGLERCLVQPKRQTTRWSHTKRRTV